MNRRLMLILLLGVSACLPAADLQARIDAAIAAGAGR